MTTHSTPTRPSRTGMVHVTVRLPRDVIEAVRREAACSRATSSDVIRLALLRQIAPAGATTTPAAN